MASGETVRIRTQDCFGNQVQTPETSWTRSTGIASTRQPAPCSWRGRVPGGALKVTIENIELDPQTASCTGKDEACAATASTWSTHLCAIDGDKLVERPAVHPAQPHDRRHRRTPAGDPVNCGTPGSHGGNMDNTAITTGATLYFPVAVEGALFGCGDMHAAMGDGEISVGAVAGHGHATTALLPDLHPVDPLIENGTHSASLRPPSLDAAADRAVHDGGSAHDRTGIDEAERRCRQADVPEAGGSAEDRPLSWFPSTCWNRRGVQAAEEKVVCARSGLSPVRPRGNDIAAMVVLRSAPSKCATMFGVARARANGRSRRGLSHGDTHGSYRHAQFALLVRSASASRRRQSTVTLRWKTGSKSSRNAWIIAAGFAATSIEKQVADLRFVYYDILNSSHASSTSVLSDLHLNCKHRLKW